MKKGTSAQENATRLEILNALFPEGVKTIKVWNELIIPLRSNSRKEHLSLETLEIISDRKLKLKKRIREHFPEIHDQLRIIFHGDMDLQRKITEGTWRFSESHRPYSRHIIVLHGVTPQETLMDWAAQAVISMLIRYLDVTI